MYTRGLSRGLQDLDLLRCEHGNKHNDRAGGTKINGIWNSAAAGAYPADLNLWIAQSFGQLVATHKEIPQHPIVAKFKEKTTGLVHEVSATPRPVIETTPTPSIQPSPAAQPVITGEPNSTSSMPIKEEVIKSPLKPLPQVKEELPHPNLTPYPANHLRALNLSAEAT